MPRLYTWLREDIDVPVSRTYGYVTKFFRKHWKIEKSHALDAYVVAVRKAKIEPQHYEKEQVYHFMQFRRHKRNLVSRTEDRKYYQKIDGKLVCVAKNRGQGRIGQDKLPGLDEYRQDHGDIAVSQLIVKKQKRKEGEKDDRDRNKKLCDKTVTWHPGDVVRYKGKRKVIKGTESHGKKATFAGGDPKEKFSTKEFQLLYHNQGVVCYSKKPQEEDLHRNLTLDEKIDYHGPIIEPKIAQQLDEYMEKEQ